MRLKNTMSDVRILRSYGQIITFKPHEIKEVSKPLYDKNVFEVVKEKKELKEKPTKLEVQE